MIIIFRSKNIIGPFFSLLAAAIIFSSSQRIVYRHIYPFKVEAPMRFELMLEGSKPSALAH
jgi:hypothetical protein